MRESAKGIPSSGWVSSPWGTQLDQRVCSALCQPLSGHLVQWQSWSDTRITWGAFKTYLCTGLTPDQVIPPPIHQSIHPPTYPPVHTSIHLSTCPSIHLSTLQIFTEHLLCVRYCSKCWKHSSGQNKDLAILISRESSPEGLELCKASPEKFLLNLYVEI